MAKGMQMLSAMMGAPDIMQQGIAFVEHMKTVLTSMQQTQARVDANLADIKVTLDALDRIEQTGNASFVMLQSMYEAQGSTVPAAPTNYDVPMQPQLPAMNGVSQHVGSENSGGFEHGGTTDLDTRSGLSGTFAGY